MCSKGSGSLFESNLSEHKIGETLVESCCDRSSLPTYIPDFLGLYGQAVKRIRWMPWQSEAMKDVVVCDKPRLADKLALIRGFPNGETHPLAGISY